MANYWEDLIKNYDLKPVKGKILDHYGEQYGVSRKRYFFVFKEFDKNYRKRILKVLKGEKND